MANRLQIKRNVANTNAPGNGTLSAGELGYTVNGNSLYIGAPSNNSTTLTISKGTYITSNTLELEESGADPKKVTIQSPDTDKDITLTFPNKAKLAGAAGKVIVVNSTGDLSFVDANVASLSEMGDVESEAPATNDILKYDGSEWDHITPAQFRTHLGLGGIPGSAGVDTATFGSMTVEGDLVVSGDVTLDSADVLVKDKVVAVGVAGGVREGVVSVSGGTASVTSANGASGFDGTVNLWIDGNGSTIPSGVYSCTKSNNSSFTFTTTAADIGSARIYHSLSEVTDTSLNASGFTVKGASNKIFDWKQASGGNNPKFELTGGNLSIDGSSLYLDGVEAVSVSTGTATLDSSIEVDASKITAILDGGQY